MGEVFHIANEPGGGLREGFEHQHTGHHREAGEMIRQVLLRERKVLDGGQRMTGIDLGDAVDEDKSHG